MLNKESVRAELTDSERIDNWTTLLDETEMTKSDLVREMIDEFAETHLDDDVQLEDEFVETHDPEYDPTEPGYELDGKEVRRILNDYETPMMNPDHFRFKSVPVKRVAIKTAIIAACVRYKIWDDEPFERRLYDYDRDEANECLEYASPSNKSKLEKFVDDVITEVIGRGKDGRRNIEQHRETVIDEYLVRQGVYADNRNKVALERATDIDVDGLINDLDTLVDPDTPQPDIVAELKKLVTLRWRLGDDNDKVRAVAQKMAMAIETSDSGQGLHNGLTRQFVDDYDD